jgi:hypothetical protein
MINIGQLKSFSGPLNFSYRIMCEAKDFQNFSLRLVISKDCLHEFSPSAETYRSIQARQASHISIYQNTEIHFSIKFNPE